MLSEQHSNYKFEIGKPVWGLFCSGGSSRYFLIRESLRFRSITLALVE